MWKAALLTVGLLVALVDRVRSNDGHPSFYGVKLCGREFIRAVIFTCGGSRWRRSIEDSGKTVCVRSCVMFFLEPKYNIKKFTVPFYQLLLEKRPLTHGTQIPSLNLPVSRVLQSPKHGKIKRWIRHLWLLDSAAQLAQQSQRRCLRLYGVQTGKDGM